MDQGALTALIICFLPLLLLIVSLVRGKKNKKAYEEKLADFNKQLEYVHGKVARLEEERRDLRTKYGPILDIEGHAAKLLDEAEKDAKSRREEADQYAESKREQSAKLLAETEADAYVIRQEAKNLRSVATQSVRDSKEKAEAIKNGDREEAEKVISFAEAQAKQIAGDAFEAKAKADSYETAIRAMRNTIDGYKDDYIIPNHSLLDDLADEFGHKEAGEELKAARKRVREMVKDGYAGACDYVEVNRRTYAIHFAVDAFNGKVDSALSKVKHDNYGKIKQEIIDAFALVNHNGAPFRNARINQEYLDAPALGKELHRRFDLDSVNKVNPRKEFFRTSVAEI